MIFEACSFGGGDASEERPRVSRSVVAFLRPQSTASPSRSSSGDALHSPWRGLALRRKAVGPCVLDEAGVLSAPSSSAIARPEAKILSPS